MRALWQLERSPEVKALVESRHEIAHIEHEVLSRLTQKRLWEESAAYLESGACRNQSSLDKGEALELVRRTYAES